MSNKFFNTYLVQLVNCRDIENLIIKGHILTEYSLNLYIDMMAVEKKMDKDSKLTYSNKIEIAQILGLFKNNQELKRDLKLLNKLRNSIAHDLNYDKNTLVQFLSSFNKIKNKIGNGAFASLKNEQLLDFGNKAEKINVTGSHIKFMILVSYLCGSIYNPN
jgi:hypothetical protein